MEFFGYTLATVGEVMIGFTAIAVHHRFLKEHKVDDRVFRTMKKEQIVGVFGVIFVIVGYFAKSFF